MSYYQAGTVCDYIVERWGNDAVLGMVHSFAELKTTPEAIQANLHETPEQFDKDYTAWMDERYGATVANFGKWREQLKALVGMEKDDDAVIAAVARRVSVQVNRSIRKGKVSRLKAGNIINGGACGWT